MVNLIQQPTIVMASGNKHKEIAEYVGRLNSATETLSIITDHRHSQNQRFRGSSR